MKRKIRLFAEVDGLLIPVSIIDSQKVFEGLGIKEFESNGESKQSLISYKQLNTKKITDFILNSLEEWHSNHSIARHFGIDIGEGINTKTREQIRAYDKMYRNFRTARHKISKKMDGLWVKGKAGIKNQIIKYNFRKDETGDQKPR